MALLRSSTLLSVSVLLGSAGAGTLPASPAHAAPAEKALCAVCAPREGAGPEEVRATATYKGKPYAFCSASCKVEFLKNPNEFLMTDEGKPAAAFTLKDVQGKAVSLSDFKGKVVLADF